MAFAARPRQGSRSITAVRRRRQDVCRRLRRLPFSCPGAFGFYPWIDAGKQYYGILARYSLDANAYIASADCGRLLRKAFLSGTEP